MVVMKFGGTSVKDANAMRRVAGIVSRTASRHRTPPVVIVSALAGVTDQLVAAAMRAVNGATHDDLESVADAIEARHVDMARALSYDRANGREVDVDGDWRKAAKLLQALRIKRERSPILLDAIMATGEIASSRLAVAALCTAGLPAVWIDARAVLVTDARYGAARPDLAATRKRVRDCVQPHLAAGRVPVLGGFIGASTDGVTTTLGRGGSDYSAAIVGAALAADEIQIWTDVDGMLTADPRVVSGARVVPALSFAEAAELAYFGAKVLHPSTIAPVEEAGIPIRILNSQRADAPGSTIAGAPPLSPTPVTAIACRRDLTAIDITPSLMVTPRGVLPFVLDVFQRYETRPFVIAMADTGVSIVVADTEHLEDIVTDLMRFARVTHARGMGLLCAVGERLRTTPSLSMQILDALERYPLHAVSQGGSRRSVTIVMPEEHLCAAVAAVHERFCSPRPEAAPVAAAAGTAAVATFRS